MVCTALKLCRSLVYENLTRIVSPLFLLSLSSILLLVTPLLFFLHPPLDHFLSLWSLGDLHWSWKSSLVTLFWPVTAAWFLLVIHWVVFSVQFWLLLSLQMSLCWLLWLFLLYLRRVYAKTLVIVAVLPTQLLLHHFLLLLFYLLRNFQHFKALSKWRRKLALNQNWKSIVSDVHKILDFPQNFWVCFVKIEFEFILLEEIASASCEDGDDEFDVVLIEFVYFFEEFFFIGLGHVLFEIGHSREKLVFFLFGEGVLVKFFEERGDLFLDFHIAYFVSGGEFVAAFWEIVFFDGLIIEIILHLFINLLLLFLFEFDFFYLWCLRHDWQLLLLHRKEIFLHRKLWLFFLYHSYRLLRLPALPLRNLFQQLLHLRQFLFWHPWPFLHCFIRWFHRFSFVLLCTVACLCHCVIYRNCNCMILVDRVEQVHKFLFSLYFFVPHRHCHILLNHFFFHNVFIILGLTQFFFLQFLQLLHCLWKKLLKLNRLIVRVCWLLIEFVTVHQHFVNVSFKLWHLMVIVGTNLLLDCFKIDRLHNYIKVVRNLECPGVDWIPEGVRGLVFAEFTGQPDQIELESSEGLLDDGRDLTFLFKRFLAGFHRVNDEAFAFAQNDGVCFLVFFVELLVRVVIDIFANFVEFEGVAFGKESGKEILLAFVEGNLVVVHGSRQSWDRLQAYD